MSEVGPLIGWLLALAETLDPVAIVRVGPATELRRAGTLFAVLHADAVEFRLEGSIAAAAARTPDAASSPRGSGWIRFSPAVLDGHAVDRAEAWLASAWRHAEPG